MTADDPEPLGRRSDRSPLRRALDALEGLSVGDAFGEQFFGHEEEVKQRVDRRSKPDGEWRWTDDTTMALSVVAVLERYGGVDRGALAGAFGAAYRYDPHRGYGPGMHRLLSRYHSGEEWLWLASEQFAGQGSFGNGAAMRVAPLGAYFAGDEERVVAEATGSAEVTHAHAEGIAGAVAVALAAALAATECELRPDAFMERVIERTPEGDVRRGLRRAREVPARTATTHAAAILGNGREVSAADTVPLCVWVASRYPDDYEEALWQTVSCLGDRDTTCAIVGGIIASRVTFSAIPAEWLKQREGLPPWVEELRRRVSS